MPVQNLTTAFITTLDQARLHLAGLNIVTQN